jgi:hypothetical protein
MNIVLTNQEQSILFYLCTHVTQCRIAAGFRPLSAGFPAETEALREKLVVNGSLTNREWWMLLYFTANARRWNVPKGSFYWTEVQALTKKLMGVGAGTYNPAS